MDYNWQKPLVDNINSTSIELFYNRSIKNKHPVLQFMVSYLGPKCVKTAQNWTNPDFFRLDYSSLWEKIQDFFLSDFRTFGS